MECWTEAIQRKQADISKEKQWLAANGFEYEAWAYLLSQTSGGNFGGMAPEIAVKHVQTDARKVRDNFLGTL